MRALESLCRRHPTLPGHRKSFPNGTGSGRAAVPCRRDDRLNVGEGREGALFLFLDARRAPLLSWSGRDCAPFSTQAQSSVDISPMRALLVADSRSSSPLRLPRRDASSLAHRLIPRHSLTTPSPFPRSSRRVLRLLPRAAATNPSFLSADRGPVCDLSPFSPLSFA